METQDPDDIDDIIEAQARALGVALEPAWRASVRANLEVTLRLAALVDAFPLPDDAEPAPVYRA